MKEKKPTPTRHAAIPPELVAQAKTGDQAAFTELYNLTCTELFRSIRAMVRDEDLAWDIQQDTYLRAFRSLDKLEADGAFLSWLRRIAVNVTASKMAQRLPMNFSDLADEEGELPELPDLSADTQPEAALDRKETARLVREILAGLPEAQQVILGMRYYEELSVNEIAELLQLAPGTVKSQLFRGRRRVEAEVRALEQQGVKLYGMSPMAFFVMLLRQLEPTKRAERKVLAAVLTKASAAGAALSESTAGAVLTGAGGAVGMKVTTATLGQILLHGAAGKVLAGALALAMLGGSVWACTKLFRGLEPEIGDYQPTQTVGVASDEDLEPPTEPRLYQEQTEPPVTRSAEDGEEQTEPEPSETDAPPEPTEPPAPPAPQQPQQPPAPEAPPPAASSEPEPSEPDASQEPAEPAAPAGPEEPGAPEPSEPEAPTPSEPEPTEPEPSEPEPTEPEPTEPESTEPEPTADPGDLSQPRSCGDDLAWTLDPKTGVLDIQGSGPMDDFTDSLRVPWDSYRSYIRSVSLPEGITHLGAQAFSGCTNLREFTAPQSLVSVGAQGFSGCTGLTSADLGASGLTVLEPSVFSGCTALRTVALPSGLTAIGGGAFENCRNLQSLTLPEGVLSIGDSAFRNTGLSALHLPDSLTSIGAEAFNYTRLREVTLPDSLRAVGEGAFSNTALETVTIPDGLGSLSKGLFSGCTALTSVHIPGSVSVIGEDAFKRCTALTSVTVPDGVTVIGAHAFAECARLGEATISGSVRDVGSGAFANCGSLRRAAFLGGETAFDASVFELWQSLTVWGSPGSAAERCAAEAGIPFAVLTP